MFLVLTMGILLLFTMFPIWSRIFNSMLNINDSQHNMMYIVEYFIYQEKYFYLILLHVNAATCIGVIALTTVSLMFLVYYKHTCGMFRIAR